MTEKDIREKFDGLKTLKEAWGTLSVIYAEIGTPPYVMKMLKLAFYGGATAYSAILGRAAQEPSPDALWEAFQRTQKEIIAYKDTMQEERLSTKGSPTS